MQYGIGAFSKKVDLSIDTLRYYEKEKLIRPHKNNSNHRIYDDADVRWIAFIKRLKKTEMPIKNIQHYAALRYEGNDTIPERLGLLYAQLNNLLSQQEVLQSHIEFSGNYKLARTYELCLIDNLLV